MSTRPVLTSLAIVTGTVLGAFASGAVTESLAVPSALGTAVVVMAVITTVFTLRPVEGLTAFGIAMLLSDTVTYWTRLDLRHLDEAGIPLLIIAALVAHRRRLAPLRPGWREAGLAVLLLAAVASSLANGVPATIWVPGLALLAKGFAFFYLVAALRIDAGDLHRIVGVVFSISLVIALIGLVQFVDPAFAESVLRLPSPGRQRGSIDVVGSIFTHPALFGWLTAFVSLFLYARFAVLRAWWALIVAIVLNGGTLLSGRRTPLVGVLAGLVAGAVRQVTAGRAVGRIWAVVAGAVLVLVVASIAVLGDFYGDTLEQYGARPEVVAEVFAADPDSEVVSNLHPRVALYVGSLAVARDHLPLGAGVGRYGSHMSREAYSPVYAAYGLDRTYGLRERNPAAVTDTFWPMILGESGILGLLGAIAFFSFLGAQLWRAAAVEGAPQIRAFTLGAGLVFVEALVRSLVSAVFLAQPIAYFAFGAAGLSLAIERYARLERRLERR